MMFSLLNWLRSRRGTVINRAMARKKLTCNLRVESLEDRCVPANVTYSAIYDPTYGAYPSSAGKDVAYAVDVQNDGKVLVAGATNVNGGSTTSESRFVLTRYNTDLTLDTSFGGSGIRMDAFNPGKKNVALAMAIQADGKAVVVGWTATGKATLGDENFAIARYTTAGLLDPAFGGGAGYVTTNVAGNLSGTLVETDHAEAVAIDGSGRIVVAGWAFNGTKNVFAVARYTSAGILDTSFNSAGPVPGTLVLAHATGVASHATSVVIQNDGKIVVGGNSEISRGQVVLERFLPNGTLDSAFGNGGIVAISPDGTNKDAVKGLAIDVGGNIIAAGENMTDHSTAMVTRFTPNGSLDNTFGNGTGFVLADVSQVGFTSRANAVRIQGDGKIVIGAFVSMPDWMFAVVRFNGDGSLDATFDGDGILRYAFTSTTGYETDQTANALALTPTGTIVLVGTTTAPLGHAPNLIVGDGAFGVIMVDPNAAAKPSLVLTVPDVAAIGVPFNFTVTAVDDVGNTLTGYTGTVSFKSGNYPTLPTTLMADYTFDGTENGTKTFTATLQSDHSTIFALVVTQDATNGGASVQKNIDVVQAYHFVVSGGPSSVKINTAFSLTLTVIDWQGNVVTDYIGTVTISSSDPNATLPLTTYTFTTADHGTHTFTGFKFKKRGTQSITFTDANDGTVSSFWQLNVT